MGSILHRSAACSHRPNFPVRPTATNGGMPCRHVSFRFRDLPIRVVVRAKGEEDDLLLGLVQHQHEAQAESDADGPEALQVATEGMELEPRVVRFLCQEGEGRSERFLQITVAAQ
jgi:hypothetical protein